MKCPECDAVTRVINSRRMPGHIYRRRLCKVCGTRFSTREEAFNIVKPDPEVQRLEELTALVDQQIQDANASLKGRLVTGSRKSVAVKASLDKKNQYGNDLYNYIPD